MADHQRAEFLKLLDDAVVIASSRAASNSEAWKVEAYETVAKDFRRISESIRRGEWASSPGAGLGATRALSECGLDDLELHAAVKAAEDHHRQFGGG